MDFVTAGGEVPDLRNLKSLSTLDLSNNALNGTVPESLLIHPSLKILNMSFNNLNGRLPVVQTSVIGLADFSHNRLNLSNITMPSVHKLNLRSNNYAETLLDVILRSDKQSAVYLEGNPFRCSYPGTKQNKIDTKYTQSTPNMPLINTKSTLINTKNTLISLRCAEPVRGHMGQLCFGSKFLLHGSWASVCVSRISGREVMQN